MRMGDLGYFSYDLSLEVTECDLKGGRRWCRHDFGLAVLERKLCERSSLQSEASPRGGLGWTCPPHFCQRLRDWCKSGDFFTREEGWGVGPRTHHACPPHIFLTWRRPCLQSAKEHRFVCSEYCEYRTVIRRVCASLSLSWPTCYYSLCVVHPV